MTKYWKAIAGAVAGILIPVVDHFFGITLPADAVVESGFVDVAIMSGIGGAIGAFLPYIAPKNAD